VLIDREGRIIAGRARVEAAKFLGMTVIPTICLEDLTEDQVRAFVIADNRLAEKATWNTGMLAMEFQNLLTIEGINFDITMTGFEIPEIDLIIEEAKNAPDSDDDITEQNVEQNPITEPNDLWLLGRHKIICGDSQLDAPFSQLLGSRRASSVFTDPPYNVKIDGHATGNGSIRHRDFLMASGELNEHEYVSFLFKILLHMARYSSSNSIHYVCMDWRHVGELLAASKQHYHELLNICVWVKDQGGMGSFYRSEHEFVFVFRKGKEAHRNNVQLGKFGRNRTNVWHYPGVQTQSRRGDEGNLLAIHPTVKPISMVADTLLDCTARGEIVLDPFLGSGTTLMAAERVGRICFGIELDPLYVDVAIRRWQNYTGEGAIHAASGKQFAEIGAEKEVACG
jgi:DNA modification methylase